MKYICPMCKQQLYVLDKQYLCKNCTREYPVESGIYIFFDADSDPGSFASLEAKAHDDSASISDDYMGMNLYHNVVLHNLIHAEITGLISRESKILEIGSGAGIDIVKLAQSGYSDLHASDVSLKSMQEAKKRAEATKVSRNISFYQIDGSTLPFEDNEFDLIFMVAAMHHLPVTINALNEIKRCCKNGGYIVAFLEPNRLYYKVIRPVSKFIESLLSPFKRHKAIQRSIAEEEGEGFDVQSFRNIASETNLQLVKIKSHWLTTGFVYLLQQFFYRTYGNNPKYLLNKLGKITDWIDKKMVAYETKLCWHYSVYYKKN